MSTSVPGTILLITFASAMILGILLNSAPRRNKGVKFGLTMFYILVGITLACLIFMFIKY